MNADAARQGPAFPTLGVSLDFLERFVAEKVAGRSSCYAFAKVDSKPADTDHLSFTKGEILGIADVSAVDSGWFIGYRRAGDWAERKRFRIDDVERLPGLSTDEVCGQIIKPETQAAVWPPDVVERSYARMTQQQQQQQQQQPRQQQEGEAADGGGGSGGVGVATVFASHAWTFVFEELIAALRYFEQQQRGAGREPSFFWLDIFVVDENAAHTYPSEWWQTSFTEAVGSIGHTALVLSPWRSPVPLRRAWCLWEIYSTLKKEAQLSVCMSETQTQSFHQVLVEDIESVLSALCTIDAETAEAGSKKDLDMIFAAVRTLDGGFHTLNATVLEQMRQWLLGNVEKALAELGLRFVKKPDRFGCACMADDCFFDGVEKEDGGEAVWLSFGNWYRTGAGTHEDSSVCVQHFMEMNPFRKRRYRPINSVKDLEDSVRFKEPEEYELRGEIDPLHARNKAAQAANLLLGLANLIRMLNMEDTHGNKSELAARKALGLCTALYGERDLQTAKAMLLVAVTDCEEDEEQYSLLMQCLDIRSSMLPPDHADLVEVLVFLGHFLSDKDRGPSINTKAALPCYERALAICEKHDPEDKTGDTASACSNMAVALEQLRRIDEARVLSERALRVGERAHGPGHIEVATFCTNLGNLLEDEYGEHDQALQLYHRARDICHVRYGVTNPETIDVNVRIGQTLLNEVYLATESERGGMVAVAAAEEEGERLLTQCLEQLMKTGEEMEDQMVCAKQLLKLFERKGRKKDMRRMEKTVDMLRAWVSDSSSDSSSEESEDSDEDGATDGSDGETPSHLDEIRNRVRRQLGGEHDEQLCVADIEAFLCALEDMQDDSDDSDEEPMREQLLDLIAAAKRRDEVEAMLARAAAMSPSAAAAAAAAVGGGGDLSGTPQGKGRSPRLTLCLDAERMFDAHLQTFARIRQLATPETATMHSQVFCSGGVGAEKQHVRERILPRLEQNGWKIRGGVERLWNKEMDLAVVSVGCDRSDTRLLELILSAEHVDQQQTQEKHPHDCQTPTGERTANRFAARVDAPAEGVPPQGRHENYINIITRTTHVLTGDQDRPASQGGGGPRVSGPSATIGESCTTGRMLAEEAAAADAVKMASFLAAHKLSVYTSTFAAAGLDYPRMMVATKEELLALGLKEFHARRIIRHRSSVAAAAEPEPEPFSNQMAGLAAAVEEAVPPSHAYGRAKTTGDTKSTTPSDQRANPEVGHGGGHSPQPLASNFPSACQLSAASTQILRLNGIQSAHELRRLGAHELIMLGLSEDESARVVRWKTTRQQE
eukprot:COSAG01_NODE_1371_length_10547_cov_22.320827_5_plen_1287_part_00